MASILYPPPFPQSTLGTAVSVVNGTNLNNAQCFSTIATAAPTVIIPAITPNPCVQQTNANNATLFPNYSSTLNASQAPSGWTLPLLNQTNVNNATVFPAFLN